MFVLVGGVGMIAAFGHGLGARHAAERDMSLRGQRHHDREGGRGGRHRSWTISRDEFAVLDNLRVMSFLAFLACVALLCLGLKTLRALKVQSLEFTTRVFKMNMIRMVVVLFLGVAFHHFANDTRHIIENHHGRFRKGNNRKLSEFKIESDEIMDNDWDFPNVEPHDNF
jgi:hypothetical protein